jgi:hypothetical protein
MRKTGHTTVCITSETKDRLLGHKAPGQSYNGFIIQLLQKWETGDGKKPRTVSVFSRDGESGR